MLKRVKYQGVSLPIPMIEEIKKHIKNNPQIHGVPEFVRIAIREKIRANIRPSHSWRPKIRYNWATK